MVARIPSRVLSVAEKKNISTRIGRPENIHTTLLQLFQTRYAFGFSVGRAPDQLTGPFA